MNNSFLKVCIKNFIITTIVFAIPYLIAKHLLSININTFFYVVVYATTVIARTFADKRKWDRE